MSTRSVVTFKQKGNPTFHVYKHCDGYPDTMLPLITASLAKAWPLPRYENDEFATAFIATAKDSCGDVRLTTSYKAHGDLDYRYEIDQTNDKRVIVKCYAVNGYSKNDSTIWKLESKHDLVMGGK